MRRLFDVRVSIAAALVASVVTAASAQDAAKDSATKDAAPVRYSAVAVNVDPSVNLTATTVQITVDRWSSEAERDLLLTSAGGGQGALLKALQNMPRAGTIRTPDSVTYDLRYARQTPIEGGGTEVMLVTDRQMSFVEAANRPRTADYPFMVIQLRLDPTGEGEGTITVAAKIMASAKSRYVIVENLGSQPVQLTKVRVEP